MKQRIPTIRFPLDMALNTQTLKTRSLTAVVFVVVMAVGLFGNAWTYFSLFSFLLVACWREYGKLIDRIQQRADRGNDRAGGRGAREAEAQR